MSQENPSLALLVALLDQAYDHRSWHGPNLLGSLRGVSWKQALERPGPQRHCIWEIVLHCAYWKYVALRKLSPGMKRGSFLLKPANWPQLPGSPTPEDWEAAKACLHVYHESLRRRVLALEPHDLQTRAGEWSVWQTLSGVAAHDLYHAGQIQLLKKLTARG